MSAVITPSRKSGFMKSSWHEKPVAQQTFGQRLLNFIQPADLPMPPIRVGKIPVYSCLDQVLWVARRAAVPIAAQAVSQHFFKRNWHPLLAMLVYTLTYTLVGINTVWVLTALAQKWGVLDGKVPRDKVPDSRVEHLARTYQTSTLIRVGCGIMLLYDAKAQVSISVFLPLKALLFTLILDTGFYAAHRASHEIPFLWRLHSTHHMTKHPSPALAILSDDLQESWEVCLLPLATTYLTSRLVPFSFHEWFLVACYILSGEVVGHSGVRAHIEAALTSPFLRWLGADLTVEDHDMHHRSGWRKATNYGKQSRLLDWAMNTRGERDEAREDNIDWSLSVWDEVPAASIPQE